MNKQTKRKLIGVSMLLSILVLPYGWAGGQASRDQANVISVDFWSAPNQGQFNFWTQIANEFNGLQRQIDGRVIRVNVQMMPETPSSEAGIQNALATNTAPAASENINRGFAATLAASGRIHNLENLPFFQEIVRNRQMSTVLPGWSIEGRQYVIPLYANAMGYHWNVAALRALGFVNRVPETVDDIQELIRSFQANETTMRAMGVSHLFLRPQLLRPEWWWDRWFDFQMQYLAFTQGGDWVTGNRLTLDPSVTREVFEFFGSFGDALQTAEDWTAFEQQIAPAVFQVSAPWDIPRYNAVGLRYGFDGDYVFGPPIRRNRNDNPYTFADSKGIVFYRGGNVTDLQHRAIVQFVEWAFTGERGSQTDLDWLKVTGMLPVRGDLNTNPVFVNFVAENPAYEYQARVMPFAVPAMAHDRMADIQQALGERGLTPFIQQSSRLRPLNSPDATSFVEQAFREMRTAGRLD